MKSREREKNGSIEENKLKTHNKTDKKPLQ